MESDKLEITEDISDGPRNSNESDDLLGEDLVASRGQLWRNLARTALILTAVVLVALYLNFAKTLIVVVALIAMIMIHELGHFATAKWSGMKVTEYFLGFGPKIWSIKRGETEYGVKAIPAGGYVKIVGMSNLEQVDPADEARAYRNATYPRRLAVSAAGSFMHFVMAYLILVVLFLFVGVPNAAQAKVDAVSTFSSGGSPAASAGIRPGDIITGVNGHNLVSANDLVTAIQNSPNHSLTLEILRNGHTISIKVTPVKAGTVEKGLSPAAANNGLIGVRLSEPTQTSSFFSSFIKPFGVVSSYSAATVGALVSHFSPNGISKYVNALQHPASTVSGSGASVRFESPVGIVRLASQAANVGLGAVLTLLFSINIFVGIFNLAPLLPLDGGHVVIATYEAIRSRKGRKYHADMMKMVPLTYAVLFVIVLLGVTALYLDITHPIANPFG